MVKCAINLRRFSVAKCVTLLWAFLLPDRAYIIGGITAAEKYISYTPATVIPSTAAASGDPIPSPRTRLSGEQASETPPLQILYGRGAIRFLGSVSYATARRRSTTSASPSVRLHRLLPRRRRHHHVH